MERTDKYNYSIINVNDSGVHVFVTFEYSYGYVTTVTHTEPLGDIVDTLVWNSTSTIFTETIHYDRCPVTLDEINESIVNILNYRTGKNGFVTSEDKKDLQTKVDEMNNIINTLLIAGL